MTRGAACDLLAGAESTCAQARLMMNDYYSTSGELYLSLASAGNAFQRYVRPCVRACVCVEANCGGKPPESGLVIYFPHEQNIKEKNFFSQAISTHCELTEHSQIEGTFEPSQ